MSSRVEPAQRIGSEVASAVRSTVYAVAESAGFPVTEMSLVGRLDAETSGIMVFTNDSMLNDAITRPIAISAHVPIDPAFKVKEYTLTLLSPAFAEESNGGPNCVYKALCESLASPMTFVHNGKLHVTNRSLIMMMLLHATTILTLFV